MSEVCQPVSPRPTNLARTLWLASKGSFGPPPCVLGGGAGQAFHSVPRISLQTISHAMTITSNEDQRHVSFDFFPSSSFPPETSTIFLPHAAAFASIIPLCSIVDDALLSLLPHPLPQLRALPSRRAFPVLMKLGALRSPGGFINNGCGENLLFTSKLAVPFYLYVASLLWFFLVAFEFFLSLNKLEFMVGHTMIP